MMLPGAALAQCNGQWDVSGPLGFTQSSGHSGTFNLTLNGTVLSGNAADTIGALTFTNPIEGTLIGNDFAITVYWANGAVGAYRGRISPAGWIVGETHDVIHPNNVANFRSERPLRCIVAATPQTTPPTARPRITKRLVPRAAREQRASSSCRTVAPPQGGIGRVTGPDLQDMFAPGTDMTGIWRITANNGAWHYDLALSQTAVGVVEGGYTVVETGVAGTVRGALQGRTLTLEWVDQGAAPYAGSVRVELADGCNEFAGNYTVTVIPDGFVVADTDGTWHGQRQ